MSKVRDARSQRAKLETASRLLTEIKTVGDARNVSGLAENMRVAKREVARARKKKVGPPKGKYRVIYADAPWHYGNSA